jgi:hypothetical protein
MKGSRMKISALVILAFVIGAFPQEGRKPVELITAEDVKYWDDAAKSLKPSDRKLINPKEIPFFTAVRMDGPKIEVVKPTTSKVGSPFELWVKFVSQDSALDVSSIHVVAKKWMFNSFRFERDITDRVRPYISNQEIHVLRTEIPSGRYVVTLQVSDESKRLSSAEMVLEVAKP